MNEFSPIMKAKAELIEKSLTKYTNIIGILVLIMLIVLAGLTVKNFSKQNEIIETGGYTDGKIRCACTQEAWDDYQERVLLDRGGELNIDFDNE